MSQPRRDLRAEANRIFGRTVPVAFLLLLTMTGCAVQDVSSSQADANRPTAPPVASEPAVADQSSGSDLADTAFLATIRNQGLDTGDDVVDVARAESTCRALNAGADFTDVAGVLIDNGLTPSDAGYFIGAAASAYCPEHTPN